MAVKKPENMTFEEVLQALETIVNELESGKLPLDEALKHFERGITIARHGQKTLSDAEQKIEILLTPDETSALSPFEDSRHE